MRELRELLRNAASTPSAAAAFSTLYSCWSHSAGAVISLCLLAQAYEHACALMQVGGARVGGRGGAVVLLNGGRGGVPS